MLTVVGNPSSEGFYKACGFTLVGTVETRFGTGLRMRCSTADDLPSISLGRNA